MRKFLVASACALAGLVAAGSAQASLVPTLSSVTPTTGGFLYIYNLKLTGDQGLSESAPDPLSGLSFGSQAVIFDFAGYVQGSVFAAFNPGLDPGGNFTASAPLTTNTTNMATVPGEVDDPNLVNLTFTYTGPDYRTTGGGTGATNNYPDVFIAQIGAVSVYDSTDFGSFSGVGVKNTGTATAGTAAFNAGSLSVPNGAVPEPATWAMMVIGFGAVGAGLRSRRSSDNAVVSLG